jgi:hypothetical protein
MLEEIDRPYDHRAEDDPQKLVPIEERKSPEGRLGPVIERDPKHGDERDDQ